MAVKVVGEECLHHVWHSNSFSSELSSTEVTHLYCSALEQHVILSLIVQERRWRLLRDATGWDGHRCTYMKKSGTCIANTCPQ